MNIVEGIARMAREAPDRPALIGPEGDLTYRALMGGVSTFASCLAAAGVGQGDRVSLHLQGGRPMILGTLAVAYLGAVSVALPLGGRGGGDKLRRQCGVTHVLHNLPEADASRFATSGCVVISLRQLEQQDNVVRRAVMAPVEPGDIWRIGTSSGTTGTPKAMEFTAGELVVRSHLVRTVYPLAPEDRMLVAMGPGMPFAFHYWLRPLYSGASVAVPDQLDARFLHQYLRRERITIMITTPAVVIDLANAAAEPGSAFAAPPQQLHTLVSGGGSITPATQAALRQHVCAGFHINYGTSEVGLIAVADPKTQLQDPACAGRLVPWMEVQAVDIKGEPLPPGRPGRLRMRSATMARGYVDPARSSEVPSHQDASGFRDGWFYSGDIGSVASDGLVHLSGRPGDVLNLSGAKIEAAVIEAAIAEDPLVTECAALAVTATDGKQVLVAVLAASGPVDKDAVIRRCADRLGAQWAPKAVLVMDKLPRSDAGKVQRQRLQSRLQVGPRGVKEA
jgi:long-chain acyl-CoA synthetase